MGTEYSVKYTYQPSSYNFRVGYLSLAVPTYGYQENDFSTGNAGYDTQESRLIILASLPFSLCHAKEISSKQFLNNP